MKEREMLVAEATTAWRPRDLTGRILPHPSWADLDSAARVEAYEEMRLLRELEAALDPRGLSGTGQAVMKHVGRLSR